MKREYVHAPLHSVCGMAVPQLVWVNVEPCCPAPLSTDLSNRLSSEVSVSAGARKYIAVSFAAAKRVKKLERVTGHSNSPCFGSFSKQVNLTAIGENFDVPPSDNRNLRNSATQEIRTPDKGVITNGVAIVMNSLGNRCHQQPHLFIGQATGRLLGVELRPARDRITWHPRHCRP